LGKEKKQKTAQENIYLSEHEKKGAPTVGEEPKVVENWLGEGNQAENVGGRGQLRPWTKERRGK